MKGSYFFTYLPLIALFKFSSLAGRIWPPGLGLPMPGLAGTLPPPPPLVCFPPFLFAFPPVPHRLVCVQLVFPFVLSQFVLSLLPANLLASKRFSCR